MENMLKQENLDLQRYQQAERNETHENAAICPQPLGDNMSVLPYHYGLDLDGLLLARMSKCYPPEVADFHLSMTLQERGLRKISQRDQGTKYFETCHIPEDLHTILGLANEGRASWRSLLELWQASNAPLMELMSYTHIALNRDYIEENIIKDILGYVRDNYGIVKLNEYIVYDHGNTICRSKISDNNIESVLFTNQSSIIAANNDFSIILLERLTTTKITYREYPGVIGLTSTELVMYDDVWASYEPAITDVVIVKLDEDEDLKPIFTELISEYRAKHNSL